jgi:hypothetical protein
VAYQIAAGSARWPVQFRFAVHDFCCVTGEHELRRLGRLDPSGAQSFRDWSDVSLFETVARTIMAQGKFATAANPLGFHVLAWTVPLEVTPQPLPAKARTPNHFAQGRCRANTAMFGAGRWI